MGASIAAISATARLCISRREMNDAASGQVAQAEVLGHRQVLAERQLLVDDADPARKASRGSVEVHDAPFDSDLARVGLLDARQQLAQRALARAVLAAQRVTGSAAHVEADVLQRARPRKTLADVTETDQRLPRTTSRRYLSFRYSSGTSGNPHCRSWRAHEPSDSAVTRTGSIGTISGTSFL